jgi:hypothetical protein
VKKVSSVDYIARDSENKGAATVTFNVRRCMAKELNKETILGFIKAAIVSFKGYGVC